jgi:hypothetical protein
MDHGHVRIIIRRTAVEQDESTMTGGSVVGGYTS